MEEGTTIAGGWAEETREWRGPGWVRRLADMRRAPTAPRSPPPARPPALPPPPRREPQVAAGCSAVVRAAHDCTASAMLCTPAGRRRRRRRRRRRSASSPVSHMTPRLSTGHCRPGGVGLLCACIHLHFLHCPSLSSTHSPFPHTPVAIFLRSLLSVRPSSTIAGRRRASGKGLRTAGPDQGRRGGAIAPALGRTHAHIHRICPFATQPRPGSHSALPAGGGCSNTSCTDLTSAPCPSRQPPSSAPPPSPPPPPNQAVGKNISISACVAGHTTCILRSLQCHS